MADLHTRNDDHVRRQNGEVFQNRASKDIDGGSGSFTSAEYGTSYQLPQLRVLANVNVTVKARIVADNTLALDVGRLSPEPAM